MSEDADQLLAEQGLPRKNRMVTYSIPLALHEALKAFARRRQMKLTDALNYAVARMVIDATVKRQSKKMTVEALLAKISAAPEFRYLFSDYGSNYKPIVLGDEDTLCSTNTQISNRCN